MSTRAAEDDSRPGGNVFARYWRGGYSLGVSYWVFGVLTNIAAAAFAAGLAATLTSDSRFDPARIFVFLLVLWGGIALLLIWQIIGLWRSATQHAGRRRGIGRTTFWAGAAKVMAVLMVIQTVAVVVRNAVPQFRETYRMAFMGDPDLPDYSIRVTRNGTELELFGGLKYGLTADFERALETDPAVRTVHLTSIGGRLGVAKEVGDIVKKHALATYVPLECSSACTLIFSAGSERWLLPGARLGFHGPAFPGMAAVELKVAKDDWAEALKKNGLSPDFVDRAISIPADDIWYPTQPELIRYNVVTRMADAGTFAISGYGPDVNVAELMSDIIGGKGLYDVLQQFYPDKFEEIGSAVRTAYAEGKTLAETVSNAQDAINSLIRTNFPKADNDVVVALGTVIADEYQALRQADPKFCYDYAALGTSSDRIPPELAERERALNERALRTARNRPPVDQVKVDALLEVVRSDMRSALTDEQLYVYESAPEAVDSEHYDDYCAGMIALFRGITKLPKDDASLVMRWVLAPK